MLNFDELILDAMNEKSKSIKDLENAGILGKNSFYIFSKTAPSLNTMIKIANFLEMSIDYILYKSEDNHFKKYKLNQTNFYNNLKRNMQLLNISQSQLCKDLNISRTNFSRWNNGTSPSITKLITLTNYLNCTINDLLDFE